ncbi:hypothetical protein [Bradyrhizobium elkanii]|nr:hypothetical protein [Bradyrhizobium elkanii]MBR1163789.1 hypothetical protein [Bradyrhizobium elkanii]
MIPAVVDDAACHRSREAHVIASDARRFRAGRERMCRAVNWYRTSHGSRR